MFSYKEKQSSNAFFNSSGMYCNSPSACFVASDGHSLRLYQAVIEAKKLLSELSNPEISVSQTEFSKHHSEKQGIEHVKLTSSRVEFWGEFNMF